MKDFWRYCKVVNGLFGVSLIIWLISSLITFEKVDMRNTSIISIFLLGFFIIVFLSSLVFYFLTNSVLTTNEQIKYSLVILIVILNFIFLIIPQGDKSYIILPIFFTTASLIYIFKNLKTEKSPE